MMWTRKELKQRAKDALKRNYWKIVLVSALAMFLGGGLSYSSSTSSARATGSVGAVAVTNDTDDAEISDEALTEDIQDDIGPGVDLALVEVEAEDYSIQSIGRISLVILVLVFSILLFMVIVVSVVLLYNPFYVGVQRFMLKSVDERSQVKEVAYGFDHSYKNIVKTMFQKDIRVFLWTLLLVVPGIYKKYQYRMVPYILAEHPDMDYKKTLQTSRTMMNGEKWHAFMLDLSFIPWHMLCMITCGIIGVFYVEPYIELTNASLYRVLDSRKQSVGKAETGDGI